MCCLRRCEGCVSGDVGACMEAVVAGHSGVCVKRLQHVCVGACIMLWIAVDVHMCVQAPWMHKCASMPSLERHTFTWMPSY